MKQFIFLTILMSSFSVFSKGGDFPQIPHPDLSRIVKASKQIKITLKDRGTRQTHEENLQTLIDFAVEVSKSENIVLKVSAFTGGNNICLSTSSRDHKSELLKKIVIEREKLDENRNIQLYGNLNTPCL